LGAFCSYARVGFNGEIICSCAQIADHVTGRAWIGHLDSLREFAGTGAEIDRVACGIHEGRAVRVLCRRGPRQIPDPEVTPIEKEAKDAEALPLLTLMRSNEPLYQRPTIARRDA